MSDGTLRALASLVAAFQLSLPMEPGIVAIEEPELALHPAAMRALVDGLDEATSRNQILLTTHSAELLDGRDISVGQVLVVRYRDGQTLITPLDRASRQIVQKELYTLGDLQRMDRLDLDEADLNRQAHLNNGSAGA
jgi:predicted ATPase